MAEVNKRKLPAGIQFFSIIRKEGYLYVDKTDQVWQLTHSGDLYNYLSRPRRFGKSLLLSSGATSMLNKFVNNMELRLHDFEDCYIDKDTLETSDVIEGGA